jgi:hypothetical protein
VSSPRGQAICSSCSVNAPTGHEGSPQRQVRLRHTNFTGRSKHGASTSTTSRRPWLWATTPHDRQPIGAGGGSTLTVNMPASSSRSTPIHVHAIKPDEQIAARAE